MQSRLESSHKETIVIDSSDDDDDHALQQPPHKRQRTGNTESHSATSNHQLARLKMSDRPDRPPAKQPAALQKSSNSYMTPEPSHHAAEHEKAAERTDSAHDDVDSLRGSHPKPTHPGIFASESSQSVPAKNAVDATCEHNYNTLQQATAHSILHELRRARKSVDSRSSNRRSSHNNISVSLSVFDKLKPVQLEEQPIPNSKHKLSKNRHRDAIYLNVDTWKNAQTKKKRKVKSRYKVTHTVAKDPLRPTIPVPQYSHFVRLQDNLLAPNMKMLHTWPYHGDEWQPQLEDYKGYYAIDVDDRYDKLRRLQQGVWLFDFAETTVIDLGISWQDVLTFLFAPVEEEETGDARADALLRKRDGLVDQECPLASTPWTDFASSFPRDVQRLVRAAFFCDYFQKLTGVSAWHVVRRCAIVRDHFSDDDANHTQDSDGGNETEDQECRVCHRFSCETHGEIRETDPNDEVEAEAIGHQGSEETDTESDLDPTEDKIARDIVNPQQNNFRKMIQFIAPASRQSSSSDSRKSKSYWDSYLKPDDTHPSYPCHHPGLVCRDARCSCYKAAIPCSKYCSCASCCKRKFNGCSCSTRVRKSGEQVCFRDERCACYNMGRECDPDLCGTCGVCDVLGYANEKHERSHIRCANASLQQGIGKHTVLGRSHVHAFGLYACEVIKPHEFIGEYTGEIITKEEANRRGAVYEHQKMSYLFSLNKNQEVDSTFFGNKIRFINHSTQETKNVYAVIMMINTIHRIAMFAERRIEAGEELYFDYGPTFPTEQVGGTEVRKSVPKARNTKLVETFAEPQPDSQSLGRNDESHPAAENPSRTRPATEKSRSRLATENSSKSHPATEKMSDSRRRVITSPSPSRAQDTSMDEASAADDSDDQFEDDCASPEGHFANHNITDDDESDSSQPPIRKRK